MKPFLFGLGFLVFGCSEPQSQSGTNTNWLNACDEDADCGSEIACVCGRCTLPCSKDSDCTEGSVCASSQAARLQCSGGAERTCQTRCTSSDDCAASQLCYFGVCTDPLPPLDCGSEMLVCEDFEDEISGYREIVTDGNSLARIQVPTPSGSWALEATIANGPSVAYLRAPIPTRSSGKLFLRGWIEVPVEAAHDLAPFGLWSVNEEAWALRWVVKDAKLELWSYTTPSTSGFQLTPGAWQCLEAEIEVAEAPDGAVGTFIDGEPAGEATGLDTLPDGGIDSLIMGTVWAGIQASISLDRVVLSQEKIGCWD